jgi:hypothetical protein
MAATGKAFVKPNQKSKVDTIQNMDPQKLNKYIANELPKHLEDIKKNETEAVQTMSTMMRTISTLRKKNNILKKQLEASQNAKVINSRAYNIAPDEMQMCEQRIHERKLEITGGFKSAVPTRMPKALPYASEIVSTTASIVSKKTKTPRRSGSIPDNILSEPGQEH